MTIIRYGTGVSQIYPIIFQGLTIFGEPSKIAMHSPNFKTLGRFGTPKCGIGVRIFMFYSGLDVLCLLRVACRPHLEVWISTSERSKVKKEFWKVLFNFENSIWESYCRYKPLLDLSKGDGKKSKDLEGPPQPEGSMYWDKTEM